MWASRSLETVPRFVRHLAVGLLANGTGYVFFLGALAIMQVQNLWTATIFSAAAAHAMSFLVSRSWVHTKNRRFSVSLTRYIANAGAVYLCNNLLLHFLVYSLGMRPEISYLFSITILTPLNYYVQRRWIY